jgi:hypothetical protein
VAANKGWKDTSSIKSVTSGNLKIMIAGVWYGGQSAGASPPPAAEESGDKPDEPEAKLAATAAKPRYVYVEVSLENTKGPGVVSYKSWNGAGKKPEETSAVLLDSEEQVCKLVSREQVPDAGRRQVEELAMGKSLTDVLVFEAPAGDFDFIRVGLPYAAIGRTGALGFQIPRDHIALEKGALAAKSPAAPAGGAAIKPAVGVTGRPVETIEGVINVPPPKKPIDPDAPPSIKDLERDIQNAKKQEAEKKAAESKPPEKPKP